MHDCDMCCAVCGRPRIEPEEMYEEDGGYYALKLGDELADGRYRICDKLGWGNASTVWAALDNR